MPTLEELLREHTHADAGLSIHERVFYTVTDKPALTENRTAKLLGLLIEGLVESGALTPQQLDKLLLDAVL